MKPSVRVQGLGFSFGAVPLFDGVTFHLGPGWTGVVGENGAGKTTLLELLAGVHRPAAGRVEVLPDAATVILCPQRVDALTAEIRAFGEGDDFTLRARLELEPGSLERWATLSPGERKRWQLAAALSVEPDVLLLDEPANHLDAGAASWLVPVLERFHGVGVIVSHDRDLLDRLCGSTLRVQGGGAELFAGGWSAALEAWERAEASRRDARDEAKKRAKAASRSVDEAKRRHDAASRSTRAGNRMKDKNDSDARSMGADFLTERAQGSAAAYLRRRQRQSAEAEAAVSALAVEHEVGRDVFVSFEPAPRPRIAAFIADEVLAGPSVVLRKVNVVVGREQRVALMGPNGAGKTTLLRALLEAAALPAERVLYLPQELTLGDGVALLEEVRALPDEVKGRVLQLLAALGSDPDRVLASQSPSPGEARKLALAFGLGRHAWALFLDEPTNHLDAVTIQRLEAALSRYPGAIVMATHDERLARAARCELWRVEGGAVVPA